MRALLIGGNSGLGEALKWKLVDAGYAVTCMSRKANKELDLSWDAEKIKAKVQQTIKEMGGLDTLVVSSGRGAYLHPLASGADVEHLVRVNAIGPVHVYRAAQKALLKSRGKACLITSTCARRPGSGGLSIYGSSKSMIHGYVLNEGRRAAKKKVALYAVAPGWFDSPMTEELEPKVRAAAEKAIPFGRFGEAEEIAEFTVATLAQSNWCVAGQIFEVSGAA